MSGHSAPPPSGAHQPRPPAPPGWAADVDRQDAEAVLAARRELGPAYDDALADSFAERVERAIAVRVDARLAQQQARDQAQLSEERRRGGGQLTLGLTSLALGIPISGIAGGTAHVAGLAVAWGGIAAVNVAYAWQHRPRRHP